MIVVPTFVKQCLAGLRVLLVMTVLLGLLYPAVVWGAGQAVGRDQAAGSLVEVDGAVVGSSLLGQNWEGDQWFHSRPSASDYAGDVSGGSNLGTGSALDTAVFERAEQAGIPVQGSPADALTASSSGLDPHVRPLPGSARRSPCSTKRTVESSEAPTSWWATSRPTTGPTPTHWSTGSR